MRARIKGCRPKWNDLTVFFGLHIGEQLYSHTDNLSKDLYGNKVAAISGQRLENLTKETHTKMPSDQSIVNGGDWL